MNYHASNVSKISLGLMISLIEDESPAVDGLVALARVLGAGIAAAVDTYGISREEVQAEVDRHIKDSYERVIGTHTATSDEIDAIRASTPLEHEEAQPFSPHVPLTEEQEEVIRQRAIELRDQVMEAYSK